MSLTMTYTMSLWRCRSRSSTIWRSLSSSSSSAAAAAAAAEATSTVVVAETVTNANKESSSTTCEWHLNLPRTAFPMRADSVVRDKEIAKRAGDVYAWAEERPNIDKKTLFLLHDGPPYANGNVHIGHALNKILKDVFNRYRLLRGDRVVYIPGWDCHGLPIEMKALQIQKEKLKKEKKKKKEATIYNEKEVQMSSAERRLYDMRETRRIAKNLANDTIKSQRESFLRWGIIGDWANSYRTMDASYEANQIDVFISMVNAGVIYRDFKPVYWSPSSRTALAESELEYKDNHCSEAVYVAFDITKMSPVLAEITKMRDQSQPLRLMVWTTTPWTLPSNRALAIHPDLTYSLVNFVDYSDVSNRPETFIIASERVPTVTSKLGWKEESWNISATFLGCDLVGSQYAPIIQGIGQENENICESGVPFSVLAGDHVTNDAGTGVVHTSPAHGQDDFLLCMKHDISLTNLVDDAGRFTASAGIFARMDVLGGGTKAVIDSLRTTASLIHHEKFLHRYPYDWRTKMPVITRATRQWFANIGDGVTKAASAIIEDNTKVLMTPQALNRMMGFLRGRKDWCISRQRPWGVPIPVFYNADDSDDILLTETSMRHVQALFSKHGSDCWWDLTNDELLAPEYRNCASGKRWVRGWDTMDVWFDSGTSWISLVSPILNSTAAPVEKSVVYLEGSDQFRGWFQSSLLTSVAACGRAPYTRILTHGFVLDADGLKMSKSVGNVIDPVEIIDGGQNKKTHPAYGSDVLRWWVSSVDYTTDVRVGNEALSHSVGDVRKLRNVLRFALGNMADFNFHRDSVPYDQLLGVDQYMLHLIERLRTNITDAYNDFKPYRVTQVAQAFLNSHSSFYMDIIKDRLYTDASDTPRRRAAQTVLWYVVDTLMRGMAPIVPFLADDVYQLHPCPPSPIHTNGDENEGFSIFRCGWFTNDSNWVQPEIAARWDTVLRIRRCTHRLMTRILEHNTTKDTVKVSTWLEAEVMLAAPRPLFDILTAVHDDTVFCRIPEGVSGSFYSQLTDTLGCSNVVLELVPDSQWHSFEEARKGPVDSSDGSEKSNCDVTEYDDVDELLAWLPSHPDISSLGSTCFVPGIKRPVPIAIGIRSLVPRVANEEPACGPTFNKCRRCWKFAVPMDKGNNDSTSSALCGRCSASEVSYISPD